MNRDELKAKLTAGIGVLRFAASLTKNRTDDEIAEFFRYLVEDTEAVDRAYALWQAARAPKVEKP